MCSSDLFDGNDLGYMIGNRGRHLDSLQFVFQVILGRKISQDYDFRVFIDVGGYRKEKDTRLEEMALQKADDARILGEKVDLPPMKPSDRRIVHLGSIFLTRRYCNCCKCRTKYCQIKQGYNLSCGSN